MNPTHTHTWVEAFSNGAPFSTCLTMFPKHGPTERQTGVTPFLISLSPTTYRPGTIVTVELTSTDGRPFRGLQVKATRSTGNTESVLGTFVQAPANKTKTFTCEGGYKNMVTHSNMDDVRTVTLSWKAPDNNVGDIVFTNKVLCFLCQDQLSDLKVHRVTGIITGVITIASVILIFIVVGGFAEIVWTIAFELRRCCAKENSKKDQRPLRKELTHIDSILLYCYTLTLILAAAAILAAVSIF
nr:hypothetical protein BaRGS_017601 [Batillaria attramentaria]